MPISALTSRVVKLRLSTGEIHFESTNNYRKIAVKKHEINKAIVIFQWKMEIYFRRTKFVSGNVHYCLLNTLL